MGTQGNLLNLQNNLIGRSTNYKPIDYNNWHLGKDGYNIISLLNEEEKAIWFFALPWQDSRDDPGQGEMVTYFTLQLLNYIPARRSIAVPAAILHDTGWAGINPREFRDAITSGKDYEMRVIHQIKSVEIARKILEKINYPIELRQPIFDIIGDHDTRKNESSTEGNVMQDADILWRFTLPCRNAYHKNKSCSELFSSLEEELRKPKNFNYQISEQIARKELINTLFQIFPDNASISLNGYEREQEEIILWHKECQRS